MDRLFGEGVDDAVQEPLPEACIRTRESLLRGGFEDYKELDGAVESFCYERGSSVRLVHHVIKRQDGKIVKKKIVGGHTRLYACESCVDSNGLLVGPDNCGFRVEATKRRSKEDKTWHVRYHHLTHDRDCVSTRKIRTRGGVKAVVNKDGGSKDFPLRRVQRSPKRRTHKKEREWSTSKAQRSKTAKYMENYRAAMRLKADAKSYDYSDEYGRLESLLESFASSSKGSVFSFETYADGEEKRVFKRAFLLCSQFAEVVKIAKVKVLFLDAGYFFCAAPTYVYVYVYIIGYYNNIVRRLYIYI